MAKPSETRMNGDIIEKKCTDCLEFKPISDFHKSAHCTLGVVNKCRECFKEKYLLDRERVLNRQKEYRKNNPGFDTYTKYQTHLRNKYNLTIDEFRELAKNGCMICGTFDDLAVDHDHHTGENRGILCRSCNRGLGCFRDNVELFLRAAAYLESKQGCAIPEIKVNAKPE